MATRFATRALPSYTPEKFQGALGGIITAANTWYSLDPELRNAFADLFKGKPKQESRSAEDIAPSDEGEAELFLSGFDTNLAKQITPELYSTGPDGLTWNSALQRKLVPVYESDLEAPFNGGWDTLTGKESSDKLNALLTKMGKPAFGTGG